MVDRYENFKIWARTHGRRGRLVLLAVCLAGSGLALWNLQETEVFLPLFWPFFFEASAAMVIAFTIFPWHYRLFQAAGLMALISWTSRLGAVYLRWAYTGTLDGWRSVLAIGVYVLLVVYTYIGWNETVGPWHRQQAAERRAWLKRMET